MHATIHATDSIMPKMPDIGPNLRTVVLQGLDISRCVLATFDLSSEKPVADIVASCFVLTVAAASWAVESPS